MKLEFVPIRPGSSSVLHPTRQRPVHRFIHLSSTLLLHPLLIHPSSPPSICHSIHPSIHPLLRPSSTLLLHPSILPSVHQSSPPSILPSIHPLLRPSLHPSIHQFYACLCASL